MSSHHIVRDEQEPALIVADLDLVALDLINGLLEWSPTVVLYSHQVDRAIQMGFKIDVVICHEQHIQVLMPQLAYQHPLKFISGKDPTHYLYDALNYLIATKHKAVNLILPFNAETRQSILHFSNRIQVVVFDSGYKWYKVTSGFSKWFAANQQLRTIDGSVRLLGPVVQSSNCSFGMLEEGKVTVQTASTFIWLGEKIG